MVAARRARGLGPAATALKALGKGIDTIRIAFWVCRHEVVIIPGMGVLETIVPVRPWQFPYDLFVLCAAGRIFRTKVALVSAGASVAERAADPVAVHRGGTAGVLPVLPGLRCHGMP